MESGREERRANLLPEKDDAVGSETKDIQASITDQAKVGRGCDRKAIIDERRVFNGIAIITRREELHHSDDEGCLLDVVLVYFHKKIGF